MRIVPGGVMGTPQDKLPDTSGSVEEGEILLREIDALYREGKAHLEARRYADALAALRKARLMYASHYKDTDTLIVEAQTAMQKETWQARPQVAVKKGCFTLF
jgi:hypothetical protein